MELIRKARNAGLTFNAVSDTVEAGKNAVSDRLVITGPPRASALAQDLLGQKEGVLSYLALEREAVMTLFEVRDLLDAWRGAAFEFAETLGWPELRPEPHYTIGPGEYVWRRFIASASIPGLQRGFDALKQQLKQVAPPDAIKAERFS